MSLSGRDTSLLGPTNVASSSIKAVIIYPQGDLLLHVKFDDDSSTDYRVSMSALRGESDYFSTLLDSSKFSEGIAIKSRLAGFRRTRTDIASLPISELPRVTLSEVGVGPNAVHSVVETAFELFLGILHSSSPSKPEGSKARVRLLYSFVVYFADRFAAVDAVRSYMLEHCSDVLCMKFDKVGKSSTSTSKEATRRQMLYIGLILGCPDIVEHYSASLVIWGSSRWLDVHEEGNTASGEELPWNPLGGGIEGSFLVAVPCCSR